MAQTLTVIREELKARRAELRKELVAVEKMLAIKEEKTDGAAQTSARSKKSGRKSPRRRTGGARARKSPSSNGQQGGSAKDVHADGGRTEDARSRRRSVLAYLEAHRGEWCAAGPTAANVGLRPATVSAIFRALADEGLIEHNEKGGPHSKFRAPELDGPEHTDDEDPIEPDQAAGGGSAVERFGQLRG